ncbi:hypothetical protein CON42_25600 [Bacillus thuringiensis]|nr:hypothetical protein CON42_25600 [Bacillus thuringiensis]
MPLSFFFCFYNLFKGIFTGVISLVHNIYLPVLKQIKGHTYGICMRRCVLLQDSFRSILLLSSYHNSY